MNEIKDGPYYLFWVAVRALGDGDDIKGLETLKKRVIINLRKTFGEVPIDYEEVFYRALDKAPDTFNPCKGSLSTHFLWVAKGQAHRLLSLKKHFSKNEIPFSDIPANEECDAEEVVRMLSPVTDEYNEHGKKFKRMEYLDHARFLLKCVSDYTYGELVARLVTGDSVDDVAREWHVSDTTIRKAVCEVRQFILRLGVMDELEANAG